MGRSSASEPNAGAHIWTDALDSWAWVKRVMTVVSVWRTVTTFP